LIAMPERIFFNLGVYIICYSSLTAPENDND